MIVYTLEDLIVGETYKDNYIYDSKLNLHLDQPILVLRTATKEEYIRQCEKLDCQHLINRTAVDDSRAKFFEISTD